MRRRNALRNKLLNNNFFDEEFAMKIPESNEITWELHNFIMQGGNSI